METLQDRAKAIAKQLNKKDLTRFDAVDDALELMHEYDYETGCIMMVDDEQINNIIENDIKEYDWQRVACFLAKIDSLNAAYGYCLDGYGNLKELTFDDIKMYIDEIINY